MKNMPAICIDGMNLALRRGTGVATYGRGLLDAIQSLGLDAQVLFGPGAQPTGDPVTDEAALIQIDEGEPRRQRRLQRWRRKAAIYTSRFGRTATSFTPTGQIIWPAGRPPAASTYWVAKDIFRNANASYRRHGRFTPLSFRGDQRIAPDLVHWTVPLPVHATKQPNIVTIHDLIPIKLPHSTMQDRELFMRLNRDSAHRADHIAVVSETTKRDVIELLGVREENITVTYQCVDIPDEFKSISDETVATEIEGTFGLGWKSYFLHYGAIEPKKNLSRIVESYLAIGSSTPLVIIGGRGWLSEDELSLIKQHQRVTENKDKRVIFLEYMSLRMLVGMIRGAKAMLFPSLYEGFGLPVLEAMNLGTPVLTSTKGSLPEIAGGAAVLADPYDIDTLKRGISALDNDHDLREQLSIEGKLRAAEFSATSYKKRLHNMYGRFF